jgi:ribosomal protein S12 methylthiotransferase accessory factor
MTALIPELDPTRRLAFKAHLTPHVVPDGAVYLLSERNVSVLDGRLAPAVATLIDGTRTIADLRTELSDTASTVRVDTTVLRLFERGLVSYADGPHDPGTVAYFELGGTRGDDAAAALSTARVALHTLGGVDDGPLVAALSRLGIEPTDRHPQLRVVLTDDYLRPELSELNAQALREGTPWLLARSGGTELWVGPVFAPGTTGCWQCLAQRLAANQQAQSFLRERLPGQDTIQSGTAGLPVGDTLLAQLVAIEVARHVGGIDRASDGQPVGQPSGVLTFSTLSMASERHELVRRPQCPACGDAGLQARIGSEPVQLTPRPKTFTTDGGHRSSTPEQMLARYSRQQSPITGVVTRLSPAHATPDGVQVYVSGQNLSRSVGDLRGLRLGLRSLSAGKGKSDAQARASALGEGIERYSGVFRGDEARTTGSLVQLGEAAISPAEVMLYSQAQYRGRASYVDDGSASSSFRLVPEPFDPTAVLDWSPIWSLTEQRTRYLPTSYLYYNAPNPYGSVFGDSNGNAAGTSLEDAILQGFFELVERDAVALWWYNRLSRPAVDLDSFGDPYVSRLRQVYAGLNREIWALDLTSDLGIPVIGAFSRRIDKPAEDILIAFGAHFSPAIALTRALTELNQFVGPATPNADGSGYLGQEPEQERWWRTARLSNQPYLVPDAARPAATPGSWQDPSTDDLADDVRIAQRVVEDHGMQLLVLNQSRPDIGLPVVKVVVPGMRHFWARFAPGRLYDVPVTLGWLDRPTAESDLNPIPIFI